MLSDDIVGAFPAWAKSQPPYADLELQNVMLVTLPQPIVVQMVRAGGIALGNLALEVSRASGFYPDIVLGEPAPLKQLRAHVPEPLRARSDHGRRAVPRTDRVRPGDQPAAVTRRPGLRRIPLWSRARRLPAVRLRAHDRRRVRRDVGARLIDRSNRSRACRHSPTRGSSDRTRPGGDSIPGKRIRGKRIGSWVLAVKSRSSGRFHDSAPVLEILTSGRGITDNDEGAPP